MRPLLPCLFLAGLLAVTACKKSQPKAQPTTPSLIGEWAWVQQTNALGVFGVPFDTLTPQTTDTSGLLDMTTEGNWSWTVNHTTIDRGTFAIDTLPTPGGLIPFLVFKGGNNRFLLFIGSQQKDSIVNHQISPDNDSLFISNSLYVDAWTLSTFIREGNGSSNVIAP